MIEELNLLVLKHHSILEQLQLEEKLLRGDERNWCILNQGTSPAIVMGLSTDPASVICRQTYEQRQIPLIRRYSGGGTVVVDEKTMFMTWILNHAALPVDPFPKSVMRWSAWVLEKMLSPLPIQLNESDYAIGNQKCGGNAQYFTKSRFAHHTSFLWDYSSEHMKYLCMPPKMPTYRAKRPHAEFLCTFKPYYPTPTLFLKALVGGLQRDFDCKIRTWEDISLQDLKPCRIATHPMTWNSLENKM